MDRIKELVENLAVEIKECPPNAGIDKLWWSIRQNKELPLDLYIWELRDEVTDLRTAHQYLTGFDCDEVTILLADALVKLERAALAAKQDNIDLSDIYNAGNLIGEARAKERDWRNSQTLYNLQGTLYELCNDLV